MDSILSTISPVFTISLESWQDQLFWVLIVGFIVAFFLAFGVGANDVANQFGTSVGSGVISLRNACIVATFFELAGAVLLGSKVSDTIRKKIVDVNVYTDDRNDYMYGNLAALGGSAIWLFVATFLNMPISGTHSIVGSVLGYSIVAKGLNGIGWMELGKIVLSWFVSPVLSGCVSGAIFYSIDRFIIKKDKNISRGLFALPIFYGLTILINIASILIDGPEFLQIKTDMADWTEAIFGLLIAIFLGLAVALAVRFWIVPKLRKEIDVELMHKSRPESEPRNSIFIIGQSNTSSGSDSSEVQTPINSSLEDMQNQKNERQMVSNTYGFIPNLSQDFKTHIAIENVENANSMDTSIGITPNNSGLPLIRSSNSSDVDVEVGFSPGKKSSNSDEGISFPSKNDNDPPGIAKLFSFLQILTAAFGSFAHGGNDVSNAIGPLIALWLVYKEGVVDTQEDTPIWLLIYGGVGISIGLWILGRRVIKTMGEDLTKITPSSGFTIEIGAAITVLLASKIGVPVSTTHCKVGSVVSVGWIRTTDGGVDWSLFRNIVFAWVVTLPISAGLSALLMWIIRSVA